MVVLHVPHWSQEGEREHWETSSEEDEEEVPPPKAKAVANVSAKAALEDAKQGTPRKPDLGSPGKSGDAGAKASADGEAKAGEGGEVVPKKTKKQLRREERLRKKREAAEKERVRKQLEKEKADAARRAARQKWKKRKAELRNAPRVKRSSEEAHKVYNWNLSCGRCVCRHAFMPLHGIVAHGTANVCVWGWTLVSGIARRTATRLPTPAWRRSANSTATSTTRTCRWTCTCP